MINPALNSRWATEKGGLLFQFTIDGLWSSGAGDRFRVISYDIKYDHLDQIQTIPADKMEQFINEKIINPLTEQLNA